MVDPGLVTKKLLVLRETLQRLEERGECSDTDALARDAFLAAAIGQWLETSG